MSDSPHPCLAGLSFVELGNHSPIGLNDGDKAWFIQSGHVDVFSVETQNGAPAGSRTHFFRAGPDQLLFGLGQGSENHKTSFVAVGASGTRLGEVSISQLRELAGQPENINPLARWVEGWIGLLYAGLSTGLAPKDCKHLAAGEPIELAASEVARPPQGVLWVRHLSGKSSLGDLAGLELTSGHRSVPLAAASWLRTLEPSSLRCEETRALVQRGTIWPDLAAFHAEAIRWLEINLARSSDAEAARLQAKSRAQQQAVRSAVQHLSNLLAEDQGKDGPIEAEKDPLFQACRLIGQALGVAVETRPTPRPGGSSTDSLDRIAKASRMRLRRVVLSGEWWKQDGGPLLAFLQESDRPVALIPSSPTSYDWIEPEAALRKPVTPEVVGKLSPSAYSFYRPFQDRALKVWEVFKFGLQNTRADLSMVLWMGMAGGLLGMLMPIVTGIVFDSVIPSAARSQLLYLCLALVVASAASVVFRVTRGIAMLRVESKSDASIQGAVWDRLLRLPLPFFRSYTSGDLVMRANGISAIRQILSGAVLSSVLSGVFSLFNFALLFYYSIPLALLAALLVGINMAVGISISYYTLRYQRPLFELQGKISGQVLQFITGIAKLRVAGAEAHAFGVWAKGFSRQKRLDLSTSKLINVMVVFNEIFPILTSMVIFSALAFWAGPGMSTGKFLAFNAAFSMFMFAMLDLCSSFMSIQHAVPIYERAKPILDSLPEVSEAKQDPGELTGRIELSHVSFRYDQEGPLILRDVSFQIRPGEFVAIVGPSGSGKSTLFRLLLGFETPESGTIYYDGLDLAGLDVQLVRRRLGVVLQNGKLTPGDIYQNIVGSSLLPLEDAWDAARKAGFDEDLRLMPMGMHTVLSEGAATLSGGQRQRLMIARAIVAKPRILLFDEATSALDNRTQAIVSQSLDKLQATRIVIAHRLSTIINAHRILVMQNGRIVQEGRYEDLLRQPGPFAELAQRQLA